VRHAQDVNTIAITSEPGTRVAMDLLRNGRHAHVDMELARVPSGGAQ